MGLEASTMRVITGDTMPAIDARLVGGGRWALAREKAEKLALLAFYRGVFCPVCRVWLGDLDRSAPEFEKRGVSLIALSCDKKESAEKSVKDWGLKNLRVGYAVGVDEARKAGLFISEGRGINPATLQKEPVLFTEPALLAVLPDGILYAAWIQSQPYARPHVAEILTAVDNFVARGLPEPRGSA
jgi:peroxiredoxin